MSQLIEKAVAEARKLPAADQDAIAALILAEIDDDRRWDELLPLTRKTVRSCGKSGRTGARG